MTSYKKLGFLLAMSGNREIFEIDNEDHWKYLYGATYKHFVEWSEKHSRYGIQIDQAYTNHNFDECTHPLLKNYVQMKAMNL
jgi:hypothetical protein